MAAASPADPLRDGQRRGTLALMIRPLFCLLILLAPPALAAEWSRYVNPRFGAAADIPPGHRNSAPADVPGEGRLFRADNGRSAILVWGGPVQGDFAAEIAARIAADQAEGWTITYRSETPDWAAWTGTRAGHVFHARAIATCGGRQTANVRISYPALDAAQFDALAGRIGTSLAQDGACF